MRHIFFSGDSGKEGKLKDDYLAVGGAWLN